jgi:hypothetical protein
MAKAIIEIDVNEETLAYKLNCTGEGLALHIAGIIMQIYADSQGSAYLGDQNAIEEVIIEEGTTIEH